MKNEHNQWAYLFFFIHLDETRPNDYTALELYVSRLVSWFFNGSTQVWIQDVGVLAWRPRPPEL